MADLPAPSFELLEQGGYGNRISVSRIRIQPAAAADPVAPSTGKLNRHGQATVNLHPQPSFGAAVAGMGVSAETWGCPGQIGRLLGVPVAREASLRSASGQSA